MLSGMHVAISWDMRAPLSSCLTASLLLLAAACADSRDLDLTEKGDGGRGAGGAAGGGGSGAGGAGGSATGGSGGHGGGSGGSGGLGGGTGGAAGSACGSKTCLSGERCCYACIGLCVPADLPCPVFYDDPCSGRDAGGGKDADSDDPRGCGADDACAALEGDYYTALAAARSCALRASSQCGYSVQTSLACPGCVTWVNTREKLDAIRKEWIANDCARCARMCPAMLCAPPGIGVCVAKQPAAGDSSGICVDSRGPVP